MKHWRRKMSLGRVAQSCIVHPNIVEMAIHPIQPPGHPATARFEKSDFELRETITDATHDETL